MAQPTDEPKVSILPEPELNPLLNPLLAAHMGRWAEVYFTNPPEKRAQAVSELVRELTNNPATQQVSTERSNEPVHETEQEQPKHVASRVRLRRRQPSYAELAGTEIQRLIDFVECAACLWQRFRVRSRSKTKRRRRRLLQHAGMNPKPHPVTQRFPSTLNRLPTSPFATMTTKRTKDRRSRGGKRDRRSCICYRSISLSPRPVTTGSIWGQRWRSFSPYWCM